MSRTALCLVFLAAMFAGPASAAELRLEIADGYVTLIATDTPLRQILAEWAKVGGTRFVNAERVAGPAVTIQLQQVPEQEALAVLLRSVAGYLAAPRRAGARGASVYESVMILATSTPPATQPPATAARGPVIRGIPSQVDTGGGQQLTLEGDDQMASDGFITVGSAPTSRQTPAAGAGATVGPSFPPVPGAGTRTSNRQPASTPGGFPTRPTAMPTPTPAGTTTQPPAGMPPRPTTVQPGILLPNDGTRIQTNPDAEP